MTRRLDDTRVHHRRKVTISYTFEVRSIWHEAIYFFSLGGLPPPRTPPESRPLAGPKYAISNIKSIFLLFFGRPEAGLCGGSGGWQRPQRKVLYKTRLGKLYLEFSNWILTRFGHVRILRPGLYTEFRAGSI